MSTDVVIRPASPDDVDVLDRFVRELAHEEGLTVEATKRDLAEVLFGADSFARAVLAEVDEQIVGFALFYAKYSTIVGRQGLHLEDLYVVPQYRDRHVGSAFLAFLQDVAGPRGIVDWWVLRDNEPALGFYRRLGAVEMDHIAVYRLTPPTEASPVGPVSSP